MAAEKQYVVKGAVVVLPIEGGSERYLYRGAQFSTGYTDAGIKHALALGLIAVVKAAPAAPAAPTAAEKAATDKAAAEKVATDKVAAEGK